MLFWKLYCQPNPVTISQHYVTDVSTQLGSGPSPPSLCNWTHTPSPSRSPAQREGGSLLPLPTTAAHVARLLWTTPVFPIASSKACLPRQPEGFHILHSACPALRLAGTPAHPSLWQHQSSEDQLKAGKCKSDFSASVALTLRTGQFFVVEPVPCLAGCLEASLACTRYMPLATHSSAKMGQPRCLQTQPLVENHHTGWQRHTFLLLRGEASKHQEPRTNPWWSQQVSPHQAPQSASQETESCVQPVPLGPLLSLELREGNGPPKTGGSLHLLWVCVLEARRSEPKDLLWDYLSRAHVTFSAP